MSNVPTFAVIEKIEIANRCTAYVVYLDRDTSDFSHLLGRCVLLDGSPFLVSGVERFAHAPPWHAGEKIGLFATPIV